MSLLLTRVPAFSVAIPHAREAWRARGGLLVLPRRAAVTAALLAEAGHGVVMDREAVTFAGLRGRVARAAGAPEPPSSSRLGFRLGLREVLDAADLSAFGASASAPGFLTGMERAVGELRIARVPPERVATSAVTPVERAVAAIHAAAAGLPHPGDAVWASADAASAVSSFPPVVVAGFDDLVPGQWELLRGLGRVTDVEVVMPFDDARVAFEARRGRHTTWVGGAPIASVPGGPPAGPALLARGLFEDDSCPGAIAPRTVGAAGTRGMLRAAVEEVLEAAAAGAPLSRIALVVPRLADVRDDLARLLADWGVPARSVSRMRVLEAPLALALTHLLRLGELADGEPGALDHLLGWLRTPYSGADPAEVDRFEAAARRGGVAARRSLIARWDGEAIAPARRLVAAAVHGPRSQLAAMVDFGWRALRRVSAATWPPSSADVQDRAALSALAGVARAFDDDEALPDESAGRPRGPLPPGALGDLVADLTVTIQDESPGGVDLHDFASIRGSQYDVVVIAGLDGDGYPTRPAADAFLAGLRPRLAELLPPRAPGTAESRLRFVHAVDAACQRLVMVRRAVDDEGREVAPSPYWVEVARLAGVSIDHLDHRTGARGEVADSPAAARSGREALRALALDGGVAPGLLLEAAGRRTRPTGVDPDAFLDRTTFRVTELEGYMRCAYGWFHSTVIAPAEMEESLDARFEGSLGHEVLERTYTAMRDAGVGPCTAGTIERYREALDAAVDELATGHRPPGAGAAYDAIVGRLRRHLRALLGRDAAFSSPLVPTEFEARMLDEDILAPVAPGLVLSGQVDRLDVGPEGEAVVIDYKRTRGEFQWKDKDVRRRLQLPLYGVMARNRSKGALTPVGGLYMGLLTPAIDGAVSIDAASAPTVPKRLEVSGDDWRRITDEAVEAAREAVRGIRDGRLDPPDDKPCPPWCQCGDLWR